MPLARFLFDVLEIFAPFVKVARWKKKTFYGSLAIVMTSLCRFLFDQEPRLMLNHTMLLTL